MGSISGRKALQVIENVEKILAIELLTAAQAFEFRKPLKSGILLDEVHQYVRTLVSFAAKDRVFSEDIELAIGIIKNKKIVKTIEKVMKAKDITWNTKHRAEFESL